MATSDAKRDERDERAKRDARPDPSKPRRALMAGGVFLLLGLGLVGMGPSDAGMVVTLVALLMMVYGIHTFGRLGLDGET